MKDYKNDYLMDRPILRDIFRSLVNEAPAFLLKKRPSSGGLWEPLSDIYEKDDNYIISVDLPGLSIDDIKLIIENNTLSISGTRPKPQEYTDECCFRGERFYGSFEKAFNLPDKIDRDKVEAKYADGVLSVVLPKLPESKKKAININIKTK